MQLIGTGPVDVAAVAEYAHAIGPAKQLVDARARRSRPRAPDWRCTRTRSGASRSFLLGGRPRPRRRAAPVLRAGGRRGVHGPPGRGGARPVRRCWDWARTCLESHISRSQSLHTDGHERSSPIPASTSVWRDDRVDPLSWRWHGPALGIAAAMALATAIVALSDGLSVRDTDKMLSARSAGLIGAVAFFVVARPAPARDQAPRAVRPRAGRGRARALEPAPLRGRRPRAALVLRHLPVVPEPQGLPAVPDRPGLRPGPAVARPQLLLRPRPRAAAARPARAPASPPTCCRRSTSSSSRSCRSRSAPR